MKIDGGCHCGAITYEAEVDPDQVLLCHCTDCQSLSGSAFRTVAPALPGSFRLLSGEPTVYIKTGESGARRIQTFCATCGSPLYSAPAGSDGMTIVGLRVGTIRQRDQLPPKHQIWCRSRQSWLGEMAMIEGIEKQ